MSTSDPCHGLIEGFLLKEMERIAKALTHSDPYLRGLFGVDLILRDNEFYLIEVNPRYTASIEVLELTSGKSCLAMHAGAFGLDVNSTQRQPTDMMIGKAIYFAAKACVFPQNGPWVDVTNKDMWAMSEYADIPTTGTVIERGQPVLTLFAQGANASEVMGRLQLKARLMDQMW